MNTVVAVMSAVLAVALLVSAVQKIRLAPAVVGQLTPLGVPRRAVRHLGMIAGCVFWPAGAAAAAGCVLYFAGAITAHVRVNDRAIAPAAVYLAFSVVLLVLMLLVHGSPR